MSTPARLRVLLLALLAAALLLPEADGDSGAPAGVVRVDGEEPLSSLLLAESPPGLLVRAADEAPTEREMEMLDALSRRTPLVAARPPELPKLRIEPVSLRAGRWGALRFTVRGVPGDTVLASLVEAGVAVDSLRLAVPEQGEARGAFRLRPASAGWQQWSVEVGGTTAAVGARVREADAPRVLLASGPPSWESRFVARALEEAGAAVSVSQSLGRGLRVGESFPGSLDALDDFDAVLLLGGAPLDAQRLRLLERYAAEAGGGVLAAGPEEALPALALADGSAGADAVRGDGIAWSAPADLLTLPATATESAADVLLGLRPGVLAAARHPEGGAVMALRALGRGRAAALGLRETWRWRLEGGRVEEHGDFWRSLVDWLAGGQRSPLALHLAHTRGPTGSPVDVWVYGETVDSAALRLTRPDGVTEVLATALVEPGVRRAAFLPVADGVHSVAVEGEREGGLGYLAAAAGEGEGVAAADGWARLGLLAERSGGALLARDSVAGWVGRWSAGREGGAGGGLPSPRTLLLGAVVLLALTEWTLRRTRGLP